MTGISRFTSGGLSASALADLLKLWETPTGTPNDVLTAFTLANTPQAGTLVVFKNENAQEGGGVDYTLSGVTITFVLPPATGDRIRVHYIKA